ncbi:MAG: methylenetetrahydrofolate--tRNA-(uracil(54)-C(5))-methyltransferase (FADH(2)-oxidizing) TrmFO [bacterium]|nr:methylenetetrahydrofolate--tRNA-(uracil(54)-C(5))-methyltransferase (FADH(2)-oxidizing) TrmFO [bacterium]
MTTNKLTVIGGGISGVEAAYQAAKQGIEVKLCEMRPQTQTGAHTTPFLGEMVCSNSLGATQVASGMGLLKEELKLLDSFFLRIAKENEVPAGGSLSVDRLKLAQHLTEEIGRIPNIEVITEEITEIPDTGSPVIIATGPLTSDALAAGLMKLTMRKNLFFYDATSPIIEAGSIDFDKVYLASRYDKGDADFVNIPLDRDQYKELVHDLTTAEKLQANELEKNIFFEACLPIEEIARRGEQTLSFGPLKPVGLEDPKTGKRPHAVIQLRQDDLQKNFYQLVGFQTRLKWGEQKRIFRKLPGLENAEFERFGRMHRNTYVNAPLLLNEHYQCKFNPNIYFAGQICGVEGYVCSVASGLIAGLYAARQLSGKPLRDLPPTTANGSLLHYITRADWRNFKPTKFTFGLLPELNGGHPRKMKKRLKKELKAKTALEDLTKWIQQNGI